MLIIINSFKDDNNVIVNKEITLPKATKKISNNLKMINILNTDKIILKCILIYLLIVLNSIHTDLRILMILYFVNKCSHVQVFNSAGMTS